MTYRKEAGQWDDQCAQWGQWDDQGAQGADATRKAIVMSCSGVARCHALFVGCCKRCLGCWVANWANLQQDGMPCWLHISSMWKVDGVGAGNYQ